MWFVWRFMKSWSVGCTLANSSDRWFSAKIQEPEIYSILFWNLFQVLLEAVDKHLLFPGVDVMRTLGERDCLQTRHISAIESDGPGEYSATWEVLRELGLEKLATASDCRVIRWGKNNFQHRKQKVWQNIVFKRSKLLLTDTSPSALGSERPRLRRRELPVCSTRWTGGGTWRRAFCSEEIFIDIE